MCPSLSRLVLAGLALLSAAPAARALLVFNYSASTNERFSSGFPDASVENESFFLSDYDLSGIGWTSANRGVTLISPRHFVTAEHVKPAPRSTVSFLGGDGSVHGYTVDSIYTVLHGSENTDLVVGRLSTPVDPDHQITHYPTLVLSSLNDYLDLSLVAFGQGQRAGVNTIDIATVADMLPFGGGNGTADNVVFITGYDPVTGQTQGQNGDSGSPSFVVIGNSLALIGTHSAVGETTEGIDLTFDVLIPAYYNQINARLTLDGYAFGAFVPVPEPGTTAFIVGVAGLLFAIMRRKAFS